MNNYEVGIGSVGVHWLVGVRPPLNDEIMEKVDGNVMVDWTLEYDDPNSTVFRKLGAGLLATINAAEDLIAVLESKDGVTVRRNFKLVNMHNRLSPFPDSSTY